MKKLLVCALMALLGSSQLWADDNDDLLFDQSNNEEQEAEIEAVIAKSPHRKGLKIEAGYLIGNMISVSEGSDDLFTMKGKGLAFASLAYTAGIGFDFAAEFKYGKAELKEVKDEYFDASYLPTTCNDISLLACFGYCFATDSQRFQVKFYPLGIGLGYNDYMPDDKKTHFIMGLKFKGLYFLTPSVGLSFGVDYTTIAEKEYAYNFVSGSLSAGLVISM